jgi:hypothetical protein
MADFTLKANDTRPVIEATLSADLTGVGTTVSFIMRKDGQPAPKVNAAAVIVDDQASVVRYVWLPADTNEPGTYKAEWEVHYPDNSVQTFPTLTYHVIEIRADLDEGA